MHDVNLPEPAEALMLEESAPQGLNKVEPPVDGQSKRSFTAVDADSLVGADLIERLLDAANDWQTKAMSELLEEAADLIERLALEADPAALHIAYEHGVAAERDKWRKKLETHAFVPREPTEAMIKAGYDLAEDYISDIYKAMLASGEVK